MIGGILQFIELFRSGHLYPFLIYFVLCWTLFTVRIVMARRNKPVKAEPTAAELSRSDNPISALVMTFHDDPAILTRSLDSIINQSVPFDEIVVVMDKDEKRENRDIILSKDLEIYVDPVGNKRAAYAAAFRQTRGKTVAMLSGDTVYPPNMVEQAHAAFADPHVGGVGFKQRIYNSEKNLIRRFADIMYDLRYKITYSCLSSKGVLLCTTGETAFFKREPVEKHLDEFLDEKFLGRPCIIGDDRFLTSMVLREGYRVVYQPTAEPAYTDCPSSFKAFVRQQLRWYRSNQRYSFKTLMMNWIPDKNPLLRIHLFGFLLLPYLWCAVVAWWIVNTVTQIYPVEIPLIPLLLGIPLWTLGFFLSQLIKTSPHFVEHRKDLLIFPLYALFCTFVILPTFVYALLTIRNQGSWETKRNVISGNNNLLEGIAGIALIPVVALAVIIGVFTCFVAQQEVQAY